MNINNLTDEEKLALIIDKVCDHMADFIRDKVPETGNFLPHTATFDIYGTENRGIMKLEHHTTAPKNERSVSLHAVRRGYDRAYTHFLLKGTNEAIEEALRDAGKRKEFLQDLKNLSQSVDAYHD